MAVIGWIKEEGSLVVLKEDQYLDYGVDEGFRLVGMRRVWAGKIREGFSPQLGSSWEMKKTREIGREIEEIGEARVFFFLGPLLLAVAALVLATCNMKLHVYQQQANEQAALMAHLLFETYPTESEAWKRPPSLQYDDHG
ncbi:hypothetical protein MRB53_001520 [Persea americana]|uniref:Uncharacterized protein n=1 Tax=Persea americana TaxID=3435 RepID=A0ACC2MUA0_PERAE|nr:hypothetical protein MRB53_001520 [Persea americana]